MTELEISLISGAVSLVEQIVTSIISSTSLSDAQKQSALAVIGSRMDAVGVKVAAVRFK